MTTHNQSDRPFQFSLFSLFVFVTVTCFIFARPTVAMLSGASFATFVLGLACVRSALLNRVQGWISGFVFGSLFLVLGAAACVWSFAVFIGSFVTDR